MSTIYRRSESNWIGSAKGKPSYNYWRKQAREAFAAYPTIEIVEVVHSGRKTDSAILSRGAEWAPSHAYVMVASTSGRWGKSRRDFPPVTAGMAR